MAKDKKFKFKRPKSQTFAIVDELKKEVGGVRIEPHRIGWRPAGETQWYYLSIKDFSNLAVHQGTKGEVP
jgi:hypothetical protein